MSSFGQIEGLISGTGSRERKMKSWQTFIFGFGCGMIVLTIILSFVFTEPSTPVMHTLYEVHLKDGSTTEVCADSVGGVVNDAIIFWMGEKRDKQVAMFAGDGIWFTSTPVESCKK